MASFLVNVDLNNLQLLNLVLQKLTVDPTGIAGKIYYNTASNTVRWHNGTQWADFGSGNGLVVSVNGQTGAVSITATSLGLGNVDNTSDNDKPISAAQLAALNGKADLIGGFVPASQLPAFVDDIIEYDDAATRDLNADGKGEQSGKVYITLNDNKQFRWSGTQYVEVGQSLDGAAIKTLLFSLTDTNNLTDALLSKLNSSTSKFSTNIVGDGTAVSFALTHSMATRDVLVSIYDTDTNEKVLTDVVTNTVNQVTISFGVAPVNGKTYRVVIIG